MKAWRSIIVGGLVAAACCWTTVSSTAQVARTFTRSPAKGPPGTVVDVSGTGCREGVTPYDNATVTLTRKGARNAESRDTYPVSRDGTWGGEFLISYEAQLGNYVLSASCKNNIRTVQVGDAAFEVTNPPPEVAPSASPSAKTASPSASPSTPSPSNSAFPVQPLIYPSVDSTARAEGSGARRGSSRSTPLALIGGGLAIGLVGALVVALRRIR